MTHSHSTKRPVPAMGDVEIGACMNELTPSRYFDFVFVSILFIFMIFLYVMFFCTIIPYGACDYEQSKVLRFPATRSCNESLRKTTRRNIVVH